jgi:tRNA A37 methylthiotransferase MiaB
MRGDLVSRPIAEVLLEARNLLKAGVKELLVISQDTSAYGVDVRYRTGFVDGRPVRTRMTELVRELDRLARDHGAWVRLHYVYPYPHVDEVIELMTDDASQGGLVPYLDVPFQHASPRILKLMKRPAAPERVLERVRAWRKAKPDLAIRSTFIAGFPGETEAEFDELLAFLDAAELDRVGCFAYSPVEGAAANALPDPVDADVASRAARASCEAGRDQRAPARGEGRPHDRRDRRRARDERPRRGQAHRRDRAQHRGRARDRRRRADRRRRRACRRADRARKDHVVRRARPSRTPPDAPSRR